MNHVSIFEKKWLDLVFDGKNKAYGAYQLRRENPRTTMLALLFGLLLLASVISIGLLAARLNKVTPNLTDVLDHGSVTVTEVNFTPPPPKQPQSNTTPVTPIDESDTKKKMLDDPTVVESDQDTDEEFSQKPTSPEVPAGPAGIPGKNPTAGAPGIPVTTPGTGAAVTPRIETPELPGTLDELPKYPGGIKNFYSYVGNNFEKPELDDEKTITVYVAFIIEKDGSMTDIRVLRDPGYGMGKEAIRVLKANKIKWEAGKKNGKTVRTAYTLPITVNIN